jgi:hypothetical protein
LLAVSGPYTERIFTVGFSGGLIGRSRKCAISLLHDCEVSHNHAVIELLNGVLCIRDVGSTFGTYLNDKRLSEPKRASDAYKLKPCDSIKVGQTSLRWRPIGDIRRALAVCVPQPCGLPHEILSRLPAAALSVGERNALLATLAGLYVQHTEGYATLCRTATPVDLPQLERRLLQLDHVQRQTVRHATSSLTSVPIEAMANLGVAAAASSGNPTPALALSEAAQGEGPRLVRLGELVRETLTLRSECWALMLEQARPRPILASPSSRVCGSQRPRAGRRRHLPYPPHPPTSAVAARAPRAAHRRAAGARRVPAPCAAPPVAAAAAPECRRKQRRRRRRGRAARRAGRLARRRVGGGGALAGAGAPRCRVAAARVRAVSRERAGSNRGRAGGARPRLLTRWAAPRAGRLRQPRALAPQIAELRGARRALRAKLDAQARAPRDPLPIRRRRCDPTPSSR